MKAISQPTHSNKSHKLATLTALAAACAMMLSAPANAVEDGASAANTAVPSAIDSSKRVIRRATPNSSISTTQTEAPLNSNAVQQSSAQQSNVQQNNVQSL